MLEAAEGALEVDDAPNRTSTKPIKNPWQHTFDSHRRAGQVASSGLDSQIGPLLRFEDDDLALHANPSEADRRAPEHRPARSCRPIAAPRSHAGYDDGLFAVAPMMMYTDRFLRFLLRRLSARATLYTVSGMYSSTRFR